MGASPERTKKLLCLLMIGITFSILATGLNLGLKTASAEVEVSWWNIGKFLSEFVNNGLVANKLQDYLDNGYEWQFTKIDGKDRILEMSSRVSYIIKRHIETVKKLKRIIELEYDDWPTYTYNLDKINSSALCCLREGKSLTEEGCALLATTPTPINASFARATTPPESVLREFKKATNLHGSEAVQYVAFNDGSLYMHPSRARNDLHTCSDYDPRLRYFFIQSKSPQARKVVIVVDQGDKDFLYKIVKRLIGTLSPIDVMALCLPDNDKCRTIRVDSVRETIWPRQDFPLGTRSFLGHLVSTSQKNKVAMLHEFNSWLQNRPGSGNFSSHVAALQAGSEIFKQSSSHGYHMTAGEYHQVLVYVTSRSLLDMKLVLAKSSFDTSGSSLNYTLMETDLADQLNKTMRNNIHVVIHPIEKAAIGMKDEEFMRHNNVTVKISHFETWEHLISSPKGINSISSFGLDDSNRPVIPMPYWDAFGKGYIMTVCLPLTKNMDFIGVVCTDLSVVNYLETETSVDDISDAYVFIMNNLGYTLMHPLLPAPHSVTQDPSYVTINSLELGQEVQPLLETMSRLESGSEDVLGVQVEPIGEPRGSKVPNPVNLYNRNLRYLWSPINSTDLTIALVLPLQKGMVASREFKCINATKCPIDDFHYHLKRDKEDRKSCKFFGTEVTENTGLVKFAPNCFLDVQAYLKDETPEQITKLYEIFNGTKPFDELLKTDLQESTSLLEKAEVLWQKQTKDHPALNDDIGARYMGTFDGVFMSFPGASLRQAYDHRKRPWYLRGVSNPEKASITMTTPYCDGWGAGMVYTITKTLHDIMGHPVGVAAGDITFQYVMKNFLDQVPHCTTFTCLLVDRLGYVVLKSDWSTSNTLPETCNKDIDKAAAHLNRLAPDIARDMIASNIMQRRACHDYEKDLTFYYWSLSLIGHRTLHEGPMYVTYKIPRTSLYLIVRREAMKREACNCDPYTRGIHFTCHDTCALECECPCVADVHTQPCHNPDADVHSDPIPACKPRGLESVRANNCTRADLHTCTIHSHRCAGKNESDCSKHKVFCLWKGNECVHVNDNRSNFGCIQHSSDGSEQPPMV